MIRSIAALVLTSVLCATPSYAGAATDAVATLERAPRELSVDVPTVVPARTSFLLSVAGLAKREPYRVTVRYDGQRRQIHTGRAGARGEVVATITLPKRYRPGAVLMVRVKGRVSDRVGHGAIRVR